MVCPARHFQGPLHERGLHRASTIFRAAVRRHRPCVRHNGNHCRATVPAGFDIQGRPLLRGSQPAALAVDASRCASTSGRFDLAFTREKENAPDLEFVERFTWKPGRIEVTVYFWRDEAVLDYSIGYVEPCTCRN